MLHFFARRHVVKSNKKCKRFEIYCASGHDFLLYTSPGHDDKLQAVMGLQFVSSTPWVKLEYPLAINIPRSIPTRSGYV